MRRRDALCLGLGAALLAAGAPTLRAAVSVPAATLLQRFIRMRSAPNGAPVMWIFGGALLAKPEGQVARPLLGLSGISFTQLVPAGAASWDLRLEEIGYYRDLHSGEVLAEWRNPLNGRIVRPKHYRTRQQLSYQSDGIFARDPLPPGAEFHGEITTLVEVGDTTSLTEDLYVSIPAQPVSGTQSARPARYLASLGTFTSSTAALAAAHGRWVDCDFSYGTMNSFASWLEMDQAAGVQNLRLTGRKFRTDQRRTIPAWLTTRIAADHANFFDLPAQWLAERKQS